MSEQNKYLAENYSKYEAYETSETITWCSGCGDYAILNAITRALVLEGLAPHEVLLCFDVGCNSNASDKIKVNTIHGLHGRVISLASGAAIANPNIQVIASAGDGATFSEGVNHLVHGIRNDYPIVFIHYNNQNYGLTTGQASSTTRKGCKMNGTPDQVYLDPLNPLDLVLSLKPSFVARSFSGEVEHMTEMIRAGINHNGFSFIEVLQTCPTYNRATPNSWYWERVKYVEDLKDYDNGDLWSARKIVEDMDDNIYLGQIYKRKDNISFLDRVPNRDLASSTLVEEVQNYDIKTLLNEFK